MVKLSRRKSMALLAYLAVNERPQAREVLASLLWPESEPTRAHSYLRRDLAELRKALGSGWLEIDREVVQISDPAWIWLDLRQLRSKIAEVSAHRHTEEAKCDRCITLLEEAIDLVRGDFMEGFALADSPDFDAWQRLESISLHNDLIAAIERLARAYGGRGEYEKSITVARRLIQMDPLAESGHQLLMSYYARSGNRTAALNQYSEYQRILKNELRQAPEDSIRLLYEAIRTDEFPPQDETQNKEVPGLRSSQNNLPAPLTPFIGRIEELAEICRLLSSEPQCRLLTLVGEGGIGKTRLAIVAAEKVLEAFPDGAFLVPLTSIEAQDLIIPTICDVLSLALQGSNDPKVQLFNYIRNKKLLLVLDNYEHLIASVDILLDLLKDAPMVKLLITSRERLIVQPEWVYQLDGLTYPRDEPGMGTQAYIPRKYDNAVDNDLKNVEDYDAAKLLLEHAHRHRADYQPTAEEKAAVIRICQLVQGLPLALEIAATWIRAMPFTEVEREIRSDIGFLSSSIRDVPQRHRSLRALFEHSWKLLSDSEQEIARKLSIFRGSFSRDAAVFVTNAPLTVLTSLLDKSIVRTTPDGRFVILEVLRQYTNEYLISDPIERNNTQERYIRYYMEYLKQRESGFHSASLNDILLEMSENIDNIRSAWRLAVDRQRTADLALGLETLNSFYFSRSWYLEGAQVFQEASESLRKIAKGGQPEDRFVFAQMLVRQGRFNYRLGMEREARQLLSEGYEIFSQLAEMGDLQYRRELAFSLYHLSEIARGEGDYQQATSYCKESLDLYRAEIDLFGAARALNHLGILAGLKGQYDKARQHLREALQLYKETDNLYGIANTLNDLGIISDRLGQHDEAKQMYQECLKIRRQIGHLAGIGASLNNLGFFAYLRGEFLEAKKLLLESLEIQSEIGDRFEIANCLSNLGMTLCALENNEMGREYYFNGLRIADEISHIPLILEIITGIAGLLKTGDEDIQKLAVALYTCVSQHPASDPPTKGLATQELATLEAKLDADTFVKGDRWGRDCDLQEMVSELLAGDLPSVVP